MALPNASEQIQEIQQTEMQVVQSALSSDVFMQMFMFQVKYYVILVMTIIPQWEIFIKDIRSEVL